MDDLLKHPDTGEEFRDYREVCVALGLCDSSKEYFHCVHESENMGFGSWKLLGLFAQMIIATDITNIGDIWNGPDPNGRLDQIEQLYPKGYKHLMMLYPDHVKSMKGFNFNFWDLPNDTIRQECEQYTLRKLRYMLEKLYPTQSENTNFINS